MLNSGGPGVNTFDSIGALEKWVEKGVAPDQIPGQGANGLIIKINITIQASKIIIIDHGYLIFYTPFAIKKINL